MNYTEACAALEVQPGASEEQIKKNFKKLAARYHPDVNNSPEAIEQSRKISEAHQFLKNYNPTAANSQGFSAGLDINDLINSVFQTASRQGWTQVNYQTSFKRQPPIQLSTTISFQEAVLGIIKKITLERAFKCEPCQGRKQIVSGSCNSCQGKGFQLQSHNKMGVKILCPSCKGSGSGYKKCEVCQGTGCQATQVALDIHIPAGISNEQTLRLVGMGNFIPEMMEYDDLFLKIQVTPDPEMKLEGINVVSIYSLSLLEALQGCTAQVKTVQGLQEIIIPAGMRHGEEVIIPHQGVDKVGNHLVRLEVKYPMDTTKLIQCLQQGNKE